MICYGKCPGPSTIEIIQTEFILYTEPSFFPKYPVWVNYIFNFSNPVFGENDHPNTLFFIESNQIPGNLINFHKGFGNF